MHIYATSGESMARAKEIIGGMAREIEVDQTYHGRVVSIKEFGAFVEVFPGKDGLVHISELADFRVRRVEDVAKIGEMIWVKCIGIDDKGRVKLSRKAALKERGEVETGVPMPDDIDGEGGGAGETIGLTMADIAAIAVNTGAVGDAAAAAERLTRAKQKSGRSGASLRRAAGEREPAPAEPEDYKPSR